MQHLIFILMAIVWFGTIIFLFCYSDSQQYSKTNENLSKLDEFEKKTLREVISESLGVAPEGTWWEVNRVMESNKSSMKCKLNTIDRVFLSFHVPIYDNGIKRSNKAIAKDIKKEKSIVVDKYNGHIVVEKQDWEGVF